MNDVTRRGFVRTSAGAAAGLAVAGVFDVSEADAKRDTARARPIVAWIGDPKDGTVTVMSGDREVVIRDHKLVARLARAAR